MESLYVFLLLQSITRRSSAIDELSSAIGELSSAFYPVSRGRLQSSKNTSIVARSLLLCVLDAMRGKNSFGVNYYKNENVCEVLDEMFPGSENHVHLNGATDWRNVLFRENGSPSVNADCPTNVIGHFNKKCYRYNKAALPMYEAVKHCETEGGLLLSIENQEEQDFLCTKSRDLGEIWTSGTYDKSVPFWASTSLDIVFTNWEGGLQSGSTANSAIFVDFSVSGCPWKLDAFTSKKAFVCEFNI